MRKENFLGMDNNFTHKKTRWIATQREPGRFK